MELLQEIATNLENGERTTVMTATIPPMAPREMVTVTVNLDTTDMSLGGSQMYRIYVLLDPDDKIVEKNEIESKASQFYYTIVQDNPSGGFWTSCSP